MATRHHRVRDLGVARGALELEHGVAVPVEAEPFEAGEDRVDRRLGRAGAVGVLDTEQELAAVVAGVEQVEQRGAGAADVEEAGRRRGEARDYGPRGRRRWIVACAQARLLPSFGMR